MILVVSLNPALDLTYEVEEADWAGVNRPRRVHVRPGGKGVNVARTLRALRQQVRLVGLIGGSAGAELAERLSGSGIDVAFTAIAGPTRRTLTVVDAARGQTALFNEPGPVVAGGEYASFAAGFQAALGDGCQAVVLSGSLPGGVDAGAYAGLIAMARAASVPVILDTSGPALGLGVAAGPTLIKPNLAELEQITGRSLSADAASTQAGAPASPAGAPASPAGAPASPAGAPASPAGAPASPAGAPASPAGAPASPAGAPASPASFATSASGAPSGPPVGAVGGRQAAVGAEPGASGALCCRSGDMRGTLLSLVEEAARELTRNGAGFVVVSLGEAGLLAVTGEGREGSWRARPGGPVAGNPTGAGDAVVAGLADGLVRGLAWPELLRQAVALGAATVAAPVAGEFAPEEYKRQYQATEVGGPSGIEAVRAGAGGAR